MLSSRVKCVTYAVCLAVRSKSSRLPDDSFAKFWLGPFNHHLCRSAGDRRRFPTPNHSSRHSDFMCRHSNACIVYSKAQSCSDWLRTHSIPHGILESTVVYRSSVQPSCNDSSHDVKCVPAEKYIFLSRQNGIRGPTATGREPGGVRFCVIIEKSSPIMRTKPASSLIVVIRGAPPVRTHAADVCDDPARPGRR